MYQNHSDRKGNSEDIVNLTEFPQIYLCGQMGMLLLNFVTWFAKLIHLTLAYLTTFCNWTYNLAGSHSSGVADKFGGA